MSVPVRSPSRVVGRYALYHEIAAGGMATIHLGRLLGPVGFARTVAVKRLHPQFAKDPEFVSMFLDEARLAARVQHPNVVATIDVVANEGELFLIMDYVRGESLSKILRTVRKKGEYVPPPIAVAIICGFLHGLHAAHEARSEHGEPLNLVHRDVSPQNVLVGSDGVARVLDFGIAKAQGRLQVTRDGQVKGKLAYMPPEQVTGRELTRTVDIYASAVVMWEMLTGERLFKGSNETETLGRILRDPVPRATTVLPSLPPTFDPVLARALSREPMKRYATAKELALELERCCPIASANTVGEWVEKQVGSILDAREVQIAEIESSSANMDIPVDIDSEPGSDTDAPLPGSAVVRQVMGGTRFFNAGSSRSVPPAPGTPTSLDEVTRTQTRPDRPMVDGTGSAPMVVPLDRRLIVLVVGALVFGLLVGVALVIRAGFAATEESRGEPVPRPSATGSANVLPVAVASAAPSATVSSNASSASSEEPTPPPTSSSAPAVRTVPKAPIPSTPPTPVAPTKSNCDPPYTIDANGRRKYKRECM